MIDSSEDTFSITCSILLPLKSGKMSQHPIYPDLSFKVVLLTGIGQQGDPSMWGNGAATARAFIRNGAKVFGCDINIASAKATCSRLKSESPKSEIEVVQADVTKSSDVKRLVEACLKRFGRIDVLVNNVGRSEKGDPATMSEEMWDAQIAVNLKSVYLCCHEVLPVMERQCGKGCVVNVASIGRFRTRTCFVEHSDFSCLLLLRTLSS